MIDVSNSWSAVSSQPEAFSEARVCFFRSSEIVNRPLACVSSVEMSFACASMPGGLLRVELAEGEVAGGGRLVVVLRDDRHGVVDGLGERVGPALDLGDEERLQQVLVLGEVLVGDGVRLGDVRQAVLGVGEVGGRVPAISTVMASFVR
jgi:hypothetical protein